MKTLRERNNVTQDDLAEMAGMTPLAVHRYEQYLYAKPSNTYIAALSAVTQMTQRDLIEQYHSRRKTTMVSAAARLSELGEEYLANTIKWPSVLEHPYETFFKNALSDLGIKPSRMSWCVFTCFHPAQLNRFLTVGKSVPTVQHDLLVDAGFTRASITDMNKTIKEWQRRNSTRSQV